MNYVDPTLEAVLASLDGVTRTGTGFLALCPAHDDRNPSLSISDGDDGCVLMYCHAGCKYEDVFAALNLHQQRNGTGPRASKHQNGGGKAPGTSRIVETYDYTDADGKLIFQVVRTDPKGFFQRRPDSADGYINNLDGIDSKPLYRLSELQASTNRVYVVEGEKDADRLAVEGLTATTNVGGAGKWLPEYSEHLRGRNVVVVGDADEAGKKHAQQVAASLHGVAASIRVIQFSDQLPKGYDVSDYVGVVGVANLEAWADELPEWTPPRPTPDPEPVDATASVNDPEAWPDVSRYRTDLANGQRFVRQHGEDVRYSSYSSYSWHVWDGSRWAADDTREVERRAKLTAINIYKEASDPAIYDGQRKRLASWANTSQSALKIGAMLDMARSEPGMALRPNELDSDLWLFTCRNAAIDLRTGDAREPKREDLVTLTSPVHYNPAATCPRWLQFLDEIFESNSSLVDFMQRAVGYSLTGDTREEILLILYGRGSNGKSKLLGAITELLGDYAKWTPFGTFTEKSHDAIRNDLAALKGARLVSASEGNKSQRLDEAVVKQATGRDPITARFLHREHFTYLPQFKIWLATNNKPRISGTDDGIWRRVRLIPFNVRFEGNREDKTLPDKLQAELPGILNWALEGTAMWQRDGLGYPDTVREATEQYRGEQDLLLDFLGDCTYEVSASWSSHKEMFKSYTQWCADNSEKTIGSKTFGDLMEERGYARSRYGSKRVRGYVGVELLPHWPRPD